MAAKVPSKAHNACKKAGLKRDKAFLITSRSTCLLNIMEIRLCGGLLMLHQKHAIQEMPNRYPQQLEKRLILMISFTSMEKKLLGSAINITVKKRCL